MLNRNYLSRVLALAALAAGLIVVPACKSRSDTTAATPAAPAGPKIGFAETEHDFGTASEGDSLKHVFVVKNEGSAPLLIDRVQTSCGCTAAVLKSKEIAPGGTGEIEVTFDTKGRVGPNTKTITVLSNDPNASRSTLKISAMIERLVGFQPFALRANVAHGETVTSETWLTGKLADQAKLQLEPVETPEEVKIELVETKEGEVTKRGLRMTLTGKKVGTGNGRIKINTGLEQVPSLFVPYSYAVAGNLQIRPRGLYFDINSTAGRERTMQVSSKRDGFKLTGVKVLSGPFKAEVLRPDGGKPGYYQVRVTLTEEKPAGSTVSGSLELTSNDPLEPKVEIPLTARSVKRLEGAKAPGLRVPSKLPLMKKP